MDFQRPILAWKWQVVFVFCLCSWGWVYGQLRYSVAEESEPGTLVGNVAKDLGLKPIDIIQRSLNLGSEESTKYFALNKVNGALTVKERIDRDSLCEANPSCLLHLQLITENPLELFNLEVEILDINDNSPTFLTNSRSIEITEIFTSPGTRIALEIAQDLDVGVNGISRYTLNPNPYFSLSVKNHKDGTLIPQLVLERTLDREENGQHKLILTAIDGGEPTRSGSCEITVIVLDINDNAPVFNQSIYKIRLKENTPLQTVIVTLNASDSDEGPNGETEYFFDDHTFDSAKKIFELNSHTGEIFIKGSLDYEQLNFYELSVRAVDKGLPKLEGNCVIQIEIEDINDNPPEITFSSMIKDVPENAPIGTIVGFINVKDKDSGRNGEIKLDLSPNLPFKIKPFKNQFSLVTDGHLDREEVSQYTIELIASDLGTPALHSRAVVVLGVSDINDNSPVFSHSIYNAFIEENNDPGAFLNTVSAFDLDEGINSELSYSIVETEIEGSSASSFVYINPSNGNLYAQRSFDYEHIQVLLITVKVEDSGSLKLSANASVFLFILDANDNYPSVLNYEYSKNLIIKEKIPKSASAGYLAAKISAVDKDSGHNAWLIFSLLEPINSSLFQLSTYSGEIRTVRGFQETDTAEQQLVISISDHGDPPLSTTVTVLLYMTDDVVIESHKSQDLFENPKSPSDLTLYLIISLVAISLVSIITFIILLVKCLRKEDTFSISTCCVLSKPKSMPYTEQYQPALYLNTDGTLKYMEVRMVPTESQGQCYQTYLPPTTGTPFTPMKPLAFPQIKDMVNNTASSFDINVLKDTEQVSSH